MVPARVIDTADHHEPWLAGVPVDPAGCVAGLDLVRGADGVLRVLEDNFRTPSGIAYAAAAREAVDRELPGRATPAGPTRRGAFDLLAAALRDAAPAGARGSVRGAALRRAVQQRLVGAPRDRPAHRDPRGHRETTCSRGTDGCTRAWTARAPGPWTWSTAAPTRTACSDEHGRADVDRRGAAGARAQGHRHGGQPARVGSGRRQARPRLRGGDGALLPARGAADASPCPPTTSAIPRPARRVMPRLAELVVKPRSGLGGHGRDGVQPGDRGRAPPAWPR